MNTEELKKMTAQERKELFKQLEAEEKQERVAKRETYETLRSELLKQVESRLQTLTEEVADFKLWLDGECRAFKQVMNEYGQLRSEEQRSFTIVSKDFKLEVLSHKVKGFDERANIAANRLTEYLKGYIQRTESGKNDPMYQLAMTLLEKDKAGNFDYKSISKLYTLEDKFDSEYSEIMHLFKESNIIQGTSLNYYFSRLDENGVWRKIEPSFCRL